MAITRRRLYRWSEHIHQGDLCVGCGKSIDYKDSGAFIVTQENIPSLDSPSIENIEKYFLCPPCGSEVKKLNEMGIKYILGFYYGPEEDEDEQVVEEVPPEDRN